MNSRMSLSCSVGKNETLIGARRQFIQRGESCRFRAASGELEGAETAAGALGPARKLTTREAAAPLEREPRCCLAAHLRVCIRTIEIVRNEIENVGLRNIQRSNLTHPRGHRQSRVAPDASGLGVALGSRDHRAARLTKSSISAPAFLTSRARICA